MTVQPRDAERWCCAMPRPDVELGVSMELDAGVRGIICLVVMGKQSAIEVKLQLLANFGMQE